MMNTENSFEKSYIYQLISPGQGAFRLQLINKKDEAQVFFTGKNDSKEVTLIPGTYTGILEHIGSKQSPYYFSLPLDTDNAVVELEAIIGHRFLNTDRVVENSVITPKPLKNTIRNSQIQKLGNEKSLFLEKTSDDSDQFIIALSHNGNSQNQAIDIWNDLKILKIKGVTNSPKEKINLAIYNPLAFRTKFYPSLFREALPAIYIQLPYPYLRTQLRLSLFIKALPAIHIPLPLYTEVTVVTFPAFDTDKTFYFNTLIELQSLGERTQALVAALHKLSSKEALSVIEWVSGSSLENAVKVLVHKDPWAATIAALILTQAREIEKFVSWIDDLLDFAPYISDIYVIAAWSTAVKPNIDRQQRESQALDYMQRAYATGAPNFTLTNRLAMELLSILRISALDEQVKSDANNEYEKWFNRSQYQLFDSPYMIYEEIEEIWKGEDLSEEKYKTIISGDLSPSGFFSKKGKN